MSVIKIACFMLNFLNLKSKPRHLFLGSIQPQHTVHLQMWNFNNTLANSKINCKAVAGLVVLD
jgi:hypothetical protein